MRLTKIFVFPEPAGAETKIEQLRVTTASNCPSFNELIGIIYILLN